MAKILVDTDVLIEVFRGNEDLDKELNQNNCSISVVTFVELILAENISRKEIKLIDSYLEGFQFHHISEKISKLAMDLVKEYSPSHNLKLADSLIAATGLINELSLFTFNKKDFKYLPELTLL